MSLFAVQNTALDLNRAIEAVASDEAGGLSVFIGRVRNHSDGKPVTLLEYQAYESMAEKQMQKIAKKIQNEIPNTRLAALHRVGTLSIGDAAIICVAASPHRDEAFRACRLLIDRIKEDVPVWKREHGPDGPYWVGWHDARCTGHHHESDNPSEHTHSHEDPADRVD